MPCVPPRSWLGAVVCAAAFAAAPPLAAAPCERAAPWSRIGDSAAHFATPLPLALTGGALVTPALFAPTGLDHELRLVAQRDLGGTPNGEPISVWTPYLLPGALLLVDLVALPLEACEVARPTSAMLQAVVFTVATVGLLKWITHRPFPAYGGEPARPERLSPEYASTFHWWGWGDGYAWPSGHTATMFAAAAALGASTDYEHWSVYVAYAAAIGVAAGMWLGDHHWASDIVSGGLLGFAIGHSVGLAFREPASKSNEAARGARSGALGARSSGAPWGSSLSGSDSFSWSLVPWKDSVTTGLRVVGTF